MSRMVAWRRWFIGHGLERLEREVFLGRVGAEEFLDEHDLIMHLAEAHQEIAVRGGGVDLVAQFLQGGLGCLPAIRAWKRRSGRACPRC